MTSKGIKIHFPNEDVTKKQDQAYERLKNIQKLTLDDEQERFGPLKQGLEFYILALDCFVLLEEALSKEKEALLSDTSETYPKDIPIREYFRVFEDDKILIDVIIQSVDLDSITKSDSKHFFLDPKLDDFISDDLLTLWRPDAVTQKKHLFFFKYPYRLNKILRRIDMEFEINPVERRSKAFEDILNVKWSTTVKLTTFNDQFLQIVRFCEHDGLLSCIEDLLEEKGEFCGVSWFKSS